MRALVYDQFVYDNPGGEGQFRVRDFRLYLSSLSFRQGEKPYAAPDRYHLLRFDNEDKTHSITLPEVLHCFVEGVLRQGDDVSPLVYHVGFSENAREVEFMLPPGGFAGGDHEVHLIVDLAKFFDGTALIDIQALPSVKFNRADAEMQADNYAIMITLAF